LPKASRGTIKSNLKLCVGKGQSGVADRITSTVAAPPLIQIALSKQNQKPSEDVMLDQDAVKLLRGMNSQSQIQ
jgi:hypothetical protein